MADKKQKSEPEFIRGTVLASILLLLIFIAAGVVFARNPDAVRGAAVRTLSSLGNFSAAAELAGDMDGDEAQAQSLYHVAEKMLSGGSFEEAAELFKSLGDHYHGLGVDLDSAELLGNTEQTEAGFQCRQLELLEGLLLSFTFLNVGFIKFALSEELVYAFQQEFLLFCFSEIHTFSFLYVQFLLPLILWQSYSPIIRNKRANCSVAVKNYFFDKFSCRSAWFFPCAS